jgi:hypothetical protein
VEGPAENLDEKVDGVTSEVALRPAPVGFFDDQTGISGQKKIAGWVCDELESAFLEQRHQGCEAGGADLLTRPAWLRGEGRHSLFAGGVGAGRG